MISAVLIRISGSDHFVTVTRIASGLYTVKPLIFMNRAVLSVTVSVYIAMPEFMISTVKSTGHPSQIRLEKYTEQFWRISTPLNASCTHSEPVPSDPNRPDDSTPISSDAVLIEKPSFRSHRFNSSVAYGSVKSVALSYNSVPSDKAVSPLLVTAP